MQHEYTPLGVRQQSFTAQCERVLSNQRALSLQHWKRLQEATNQLLKMELYS